jgi:DNA-binding NtrC family response regulator
MDQNKSLKILYLEDEPDFINLVKAFLEEAGMQPNISIVENKADFISALEREKFDLILADNLLPSCSGAQALEAAKLKSPETPFVLVSGTIREQEAIESLRQGATDYVFKNGIERLVPVVRRAVREARERVQRQEAETELIRRERYFRALTENCLDVLTILDRDGNFLYNSPSITPILGYDPHELSGRNAFALVHPDDLPGVLQAFETALRACT